ncbi:MAG TPA: hypothetical protein VF824_13400 [Thermoanaerobaculia bacterium]|jgi:hypothetical protein
MKRALAAIVLAIIFASHANAQVDAARVAADAMVVDRVAELSKRDLPTDLLKRLVAEDVELLRGRRPDGTYAFASYERFEAGRVTESFSIQPRADKMDTLEMRGAYIYRVILDVPARRLMVRKNRAVWVERLDFEYVPYGKTQNERQSIEIKAWLQPTEVRPVDLPAIARQATVKIIATADPKTGYSNLDVALVQARIVDAPDSPYARALAAEKAMQRALDNADVKSLRTMAARVRESLGDAPRVDVATSSPAAEPRASDAATQLEMQTELQMIEDLLTGSESERREGLDRLHQLVRRLRR